MTLFVFAETALIDEVNAGKRMIIVAKHGKPVARIMPPAKAKKKKAAF